MGYRDYSVGKGLIVDATGHGDFTTIAAALTAASSGQTIFIRPGTYTENLTLKAGVNLTSFTGDSTLNNDGTINQWNVRIIGKLSASFTGQCQISNICLQTNSDYILEVTGSTQIDIGINNCYLHITNANGVHLTSTVGTQLQFNQCVSTLQTGNAFFVATGNGGIGLFDSTFGGATSTIPSTFTDDTSFVIVNSTFVGLLSMSGASVFTSHNGSLGIANSTFITLSGTSSFTDFYSFISSNTATAISVGSGCICQLIGSNISSANTNAIDGAGSIRFCGITFSGTSTKIATTTQTPLFLIPGAYNTILPAANYTVVSSDNFVGATSTSAHTITLPASPTAGQVHSVKDVTGTAGTNTITIDGNGKNIDGASTLAISQNYGCVGVQYNGTEWNTLFQPSSGGSTGKSLVSAVLLNGQTSQTGAGTAATVICDTVLVDTNSEYNATTGTYTPNNTGVYNVNGTVYVGQVTVAMTQCSIWLSVNGATRAWQKFLNPVPILDTTNMSVSLSINGLIDLTAGDALTFVVQITGGVSDSAAFVASGSSSYPWTYLSIIQES